MSDKKNQLSTGRSSKAKTFEDLNVYQQARALTNKIYQITRRGQFLRDYRLVDQIRGAAVSIMSNIAEGFERGTNNEFIHFLFIAKGSSGEVRVQLTVAADQKYIDQKTHATLVDQSRRISGMLSNLIAYLKVSSYRGIKFK